MTFYFEAAQNVIAEHYKKNFNVIFLFKAVQNWLQSAMKEILTRFYTLNRLKM